ncbi:MAG: hypothetical protein IKX18_01365 [Muribaculaceae bacterium]|nr:hypothetical protein [Muribaculaceae bacterium]
MSDIKHKMTFSDLPFTPVRGQVVYVDSGKSKRINAFIVNNYDWLRDLFRKNGLEFCYLPLWGEELIAYHAPYLTIEQRQEFLQGVPSISSLIKDGEGLRSPALLYALNDEGDGEVRLKPIEARWYNKLKKVFTTLADTIGRDLAWHYPTRRHEDSVRGHNIQFSLSEESDKKWSDIRFSLSKKDSVDINPSEEPAPRFSIEEKKETADDLFGTESEVLISEIRARIQALVNKGVNTIILHNIVDEAERLSPLHITKDFRFILPEYNNLEIVMPALPKAVFILFLRHPEGIRFKDLVDYRDELLNIYRALNPIGGTQRQLQSVKEITNPMSNSINEKCARIREAFIKHFDDRLAQNYYITGKKGEPKRIILEPSLVVWEQ